MLIRRHTLAEKIFNLRGDPIVFDNHQYMVDILDGRWSKVLLKSSRQVGKSTLLSLLLLLETLYTDLGTKALRQTYVTPSLEQTRTFLIEKLRPLIFNSPRFFKLMTGKDTINDVFTQSFTNGSMIFLRGAYRDAERIRGIPSDVVYLDEIQSILGGLIPVILSSLDASPYERVVMAGTPLSEDNPIETHWKQSTQTEWVVPCWRHSGTHSKGLWNVLDIDNIGDEGLVCKKCKKPINAAEGMWVDMVKDAPFKGFHVTQLAVKIKQDPEKWKKGIVYKRDYWETAKFYNETLGESYGQADRPLTIAKVKACINTKDKYFDLTKLHDRPPIKARWFAGIDWGEGRETASYEGSKKKYASFTHLIIGLRFPDGKFHITFWKKFKGKEANPEFMMPYIISKIREWNVELVGADWGFGFGLNSRLVKSFGEAKIMKCYHSANLKDLFRYDPDSLKMVLNRNEMMSRMIEAFKTKKISLPAWDEIKELAKDFMAVYAEYNHNTNKLQYSHKMDEPDDGMHALLYAKFAADYRYGKFSN